MNPNAAVFTPTFIPSSNKSIDSNSNKENRHKSASSVSSSSSHHTTEKHRVNQKNHQKLNRINQNILSQPSNNNNKSQQNQPQQLNNDNNNNDMNISNNRQSLSSSFPGQPLFNATTLLQNQQNSNNHTLSSPNNAVTPSPNVSIASTTSSVSSTGTGGGGGGGGGGDDERDNMNDNNNDAANNKNGTNTVHMQQIQNYANQHWLYQQCAKVTESIQHTTMKMGLVQQQINDTSEQMQTALYNQNHLTQPEYYQGLQNQHMMLTQQMKQLQTEYHQYQYQYGCYQQYLFKAVTANNYANLQAQQQQQQLLAVQQQQQQQAQTPKTSNNGINNASNNNANNNVNNNNNVNSTNNDNNNTKINDNNNNLMNSNENNMATKPIIAGSPSPPPTDAIAKDTNNDNNGKNTNKIQNGNPSPSPIHSPKDIQQKNNKNSNQQQNGNNNNNQNNRQQTNSYNGANLYNAYQNLRSQSEMFDNINWNLWNYAYYNNNMLANQHMLNKYNEGMGNSNAIDTFPSDPANSNKFSVSPKGKYLMGASGNNSIANTGNNKNNNGKTSINGMKASPLKKCSSKQDIFERKLCVLICKLTPDRFDKVLAKMLEFLDNHVQTQNELKIIVDKTLKFTINQPYMASLTAQLFLHFHDYLPRLIMTQQYQQHLWDINDTDLSVTFRKILIQALEKLFQEFKENQAKLQKKEKGEEIKNDESETSNSSRYNNENEADRLLSFYTDDNKNTEEKKNNNTDNNDNDPEKERMKNEFFALMEIIGELYNVDLCHVRVIRKGIFDQLLPPKITEIMQFDTIHLEAMCTIFKTCGKKLDLKQTKFVEKYLNKMTIFTEELELKKHDKLNAFNMINEVRAIRANNWVNSNNTLRAAHNQKYKTLNKLFTFPLDQIREEEPDYEGVEGFDDPTEETTSSSSSSPKSDPCSGNDFSSLGIVSKLYCLNDKTLTLEPVTLKDKDGKDIFLKQMESGYNDSKYILGYNGDLIVSGTNKYGELGLENERINSILNNMISDHFDEKKDQLCKITDITNITDINQLIIQFVGGIKYMSEHLDIHKNKGNRISTDIMESIKLISCGIAARHRFIITETDNVYGCGNDTFNQLGYQGSKRRHDLISLVDAKSNLINKPLPTSMDAMSKQKHWVKIDFFTENDIQLKQIESGYTTTIFLSEDGDIYTVGYSSYGNLGIGDKNNKLTKITRIFTIKTKISSISTGFDHTIAINEYGHAISFGDNAFGQLGYGHLNQNRKQKPKEIEFFRRRNIHIESSVCGAFHSIVLDCNGLIYCFGYNLGYQCHYNNDDDDINISTPRVNNTLHNIGKVASIKCGGFHNIVEVKNGDYRDWYLWGDNRNQQCLKFDKTQYVKLPTKYDKRDIPKNEHILEMFAGYNQTQIFTTVSPKNGT